MDPSPLPTTPSVEEDEWDADGFVIPSLGIDDVFSNEVDESKVNDSKPSEAEVRKEEKIYLGPHGVPPSQAKQIEEANKFLNRKQGYKQKINEANRRYNGSGRENKVDSLRELVGGNGKISSSSVVSKGWSRGDWLDPHCHESQFERRQ